jgi:glycosyltransferase involved in cell wall biosynthesis
MSIALLEAMASGLPVVVTKTGGTDELVAPGENGLVVGWADVAGLAAALGRLLEDAALRARMGQASRRVALTFAWREIAEQYVELFASALDRSTERLLAERQPLPTAGSLPAASRVAVDPVRQRND